MEEMRNGMHLMEEEHMCRKDMDMHRKKCRFGRLGIEFHSEKKSIDWHIDISYWHTKDSSLYAHELSQVKHSLKYERPYFYGGSAVMVLSFLSTKIFIRQLW